MSLKEGFVLVPCLEPILKCNNVHALKALRNRIDERINKLNLMESEKMKEENWAITKEKAEHILDLTVASVFSCYEGPKNFEDLLAHPETIEPSDFENIALPWHKVKIAREIVHELLVLIKEKWKFRVII